MANFYAALTSLLGGSRKRQGDSTLIAARVDDLDVWIEGGNFALNWVQFRAMMVLPESKFSTLMDRVKPFYLAAFGGEPGPESYHVKEDLVAIAACGPSASSAPPARLQRAWDWLEPRMGTESYPRMLHCAWLVQRHLGHEQQSLDFAFRILAQSELPLDIGLQLANWVKLKQAGTSGYALQ